MGATDSVLRLLVTLKDEASSGLSSIGSTLGTIGTVAGGAALAGVAAFGATLASGVADAREAAQVMAQTEAVIKSTGGAAGFTAQQVADMAGSISAASGKSLFGDDDIQKGQNLLLTFTNIKETLPDATQTMVDMAQALGTDVSGGAVQLGKALNDPINGISALSRVGVTFTDQQKEQIKTMQEAGDMAGAQQVILAELNKEFGGSAEAAAKADGGWAQFNDRLGEAKETLGAAVLPILNSLFSVLNDQVMPVVEDVIGSFEEAGDITLGLGAAINTLLNEVFGLNTNIGFLVTDALDLLLGRSTEAESTLGGLASIFSDVKAAATEVFTTLWTEGKPILDDLGKIAMPALIAAGQILASYWNNILKPALLIVWGIFKDYLLPAFKEGIHVLAEVLPPAIDTVAKFFTDTLFPAIGGIIDALGSVNKSIQDTIQWFKDLGSGLTNIQIPEWLQGHSPPPLANWFSDIGDAAQAAQDSAGAMMPGGGAAALSAAPAAFGGAAAGGQVNLYLTVQGSVTTENDLMLRIRDLMVQLGYRNVSIFNGLADGGA